MKVNEIQDLIKFVSKSGVSEVNLETKEVKLTIKNDGVKKGKGGEAQILQVPVQQMMPQQMQAAPIAAAPIAATPVAAAPVTEAPAPVIEAPTVADDTSKYIEVKSPMIGTFYRRPSPDKKNFVEVGSEIKTGDVICIIEAMKLFNEIEAEVTGKVVKIFVDDSTPVEYDQLLFLVDPS
ncbi:MAG: acetyl-CoA carboxylase biotin carboxyl carrier protein [Flavobacteriales bacterium]|nr:acetyl-CoA carboxylase biotin carboxyl carrier protein [Flavobacteriales bacterium]